MARSKMDYCLNSKFAAWKIREHLMNEISMKNFHKRVKLYTFVV